MSHIKSSYLGKLRTEAVHLKSATRIITDAPTDNHGQGEAFSPTDLVCASLRQLYDDDHGDPCC